MGEILNRSIRYLKGVGPGREKAFKRLGVKTVKDLLFLVPRKYEDRSRVIKIKDIEVGQNCAIMGKVRLKGTRRIFGKEGSGIILDDGTGWIEVVFFYPQAHKQFTIGDEVICYGKIEYDRYYRKPIMLKPLCSPVDKKDLFNATVVPIYPQTEGIDSKFIRKLLYQLFKEEKPRLLDYLPSYIRRKEGLFSLNEAIYKLHFPSSVEEGEKARKTLAFYELFLFFWQLQIKREELKQAYPLTKKGPLSAKFIESLPFELTNSQKQVIEEIDKDLMKDKPMQRLLQGDVGSGKTVIAIYTLLRAVENGFQAALMAPTETLADQLFLVMWNFLKGLPIKIEILKGSNTQTHKATVLHGLKTGDIDIVVGTHALITDNIEFHKLGLVVIDEQHKFGVLQRYNLWAKGREYMPHLLLMTATPIPRSLALTLYGNLDLSLLKEKPAGRGKIETIVKKEENRKQVYEWVFRRLKKGEKAYVVVPLIEESEFSRERGLMDINTMYEYLSGIKPEWVRIGVLHGRMKTEEKRRAMEGFRLGQYNLLLSTTVIEVGIDVPDATVMVIENADRFGLAQLHQLRGRVGRSERRSFCILILSSNPTEEGLERVKALKKYESGFELAEIDLKLRGPGEFFGTKQHGYGGFKVFHFYRDQDLVEKVRNYVEELMKGKIPLKIEEEQILQSLKGKNEEEVYVA